MDDIIDFDTEHAIQLAKEYLAGNWLKVTRDTVAIKVISGGYCSRLYLCEDLTGKSDPSKFLIRMNGGKVLEENDPFKHYNEGTESIVFFMHGHLGYGPKLYGVFNGGRLEEYIASRVLVSEDLKDPSIRMQIARKLARFHSMKLPVSKKPHPSFDLILSNYKLYDNPEGRQKFLDRSSISGADPSFADKLNIPEEIDWIKQTLQKVGGRLVLSTNDMNKNNCLIREVPDTFGEIVTLVDYEIGGTNWRGCDIASHFLAWLTDLTKPDFLSHVPYPDTEIRREFIAEYLRQTKAIGVYDDFDAEGLDSCDHVMMEADLMSLLSVLHWTCFNLKPKDDSNAVMADLVLKMNCVSHLLVNLFIEHKKIFLEKYEKQLSGKTVISSHDLDILNHS